jgi:hypothetical protein
MNLNRDRLEKACLLAAEEISKTAMDEEGQFACNVEFHVDRDGYVRTLKVCKPSFKTIVVSR